MNTYKKFIFFISPLVFCCTTKNMETHTPKVTNANNETIRFLENKLIDTYKKSLNKKPKSPINKRTRKKIATDSLPSTIKIVRTTCLMSNCFQTFGLEKELKEHHRAAHLNKKFISKGYKCKNCSYRTKDYLQAISHCEKNKCNKYPKQKV